MALDPLRDLTVVRPSPRAPRPSRGDHREAPMAATVSRVLLAATLEVTRQVDTLAAILEDTLEGLRADILKDTLEVTQEGIPEDTLEGIPEVTLEVILEATLAVILEVTPEVTLAATPATPATPRKELPPTEVRPLTAPCPPPTLLTKAARHQPTTEETKISFFLSLTQPSLTCNIVFNI